MRCPSTESVTGCPKAQNNDAIVATNAVTATSLRLGRSSDFTLANFVDVFRILVGDDFFNLDPERTQQLVLRERPDQLTLPTDRALPLAARYADVGHF